MKNLKVWQLVLGLLLIICGTVVFILAVAGVFNSPKVEISSEYVCGEECTGEFIELDEGAYEKLIEDKKSFVILVDQGGCTTADRLEGYLTDWGKENKIKILKIMFEDTKKTSLYDYVKYYPSVAVVSDGKVIGFLKADSNEDSDKYNNYDVFKDWIGKYLK